MYKLVHDGQTIGIFELGKIVDRKQIVHTQSYMVVSYPKRVNNSSSQSDSQEYGKG